MLLIILHIYFDTIKSDKANVNNVTHYNRPVCPIIRVNFCILSILLKIDKTFLTFITSLPIFFTQENWKFILLPSAKKVLEANTFWKVSILKLR